MSLHTAQYAQMLSNLSHLGWIGIGIQSEEYAFSGIDAFSTETLTKHLETCTFITVQVGRSFKTRMPFADAVKIEPDANNPNACEFHIVNAIRSGVLKDIQDFRTTCTNGWVVPAEQEMAANRSVPESAETYFLWYHLVRIGDLPGSVYAPPNYGEGHAHRLQNKEMYKTWLNSLKARDLDALWVRVNKWTKNPDLPYRIPKDKITRSTFVNMHGGALDLFTCCRHSLVCKREIRSCPEAYEQFLQSTTPEELEQWRQKWADFCKTYN